MSNRNGDKAKTERRPGNDKKLFISTSAAQLLRTSND